MSSWRAVCPTHPLIANVDADLLKQAAINVIQNGAQAMPDGGTLRVRLEEDRKMAVLRIADEGTGNSRRRFGKRSSIFTSRRRAGAAASDWQ